jgi:rubrerythrin
MKSFALISICAVLLGGCATSSPPPPNSSTPDPSDPAAPQASTRPLRPNLVATTKVYLDPSLGQEAQKMEHGNMQGMAGMEGMKGMDHSQMKGMENTDRSKMQGMDHSKMSGTEGKQSPSPAPAKQPGSMEGMDHSKMPGMTSSPQSKESLEKEMKKTSDEMKKLSDELKEKADETSQGRPSASPQDDHPQMQHQKMSSTSPNQPQSNVTYTCVMHPEVKSDKPGNCPKCGMKLVPKSAAP